MAPRRNPPVNLGDVHNRTMAVPLSGTADNETDQTVAAMIAYIFDSDRSGLVGRVAAGLAALCDQRDYQCQRRRVYDWMMRSVRFKKDLFGVENVRHPDQLIVEIANAGVTSADCDDVATLGAALVRAMGFPAVITVVARSPQGPFEHVYFGALIGGKRIPMDPQERVPFGTDPVVGRMKHYEVKKP